MDRGILVGNRICAKRVEQRRRERHIDQVSSIRANIDNKLPVSATLPHLRVNLKREQNLEDTYTEIDRSNRILLQKMSDIIRKPSFVLPSTSSNDLHRSLNRDSRRKELQRITNENLHILKRIQGSQPMYDHVRWEQDFRRTRVYMKNKCEYPVILNRSGTTGSLNSTGEEEPQDTPDTREIGEYIPEQELENAAAPNLEVLVKEGRRIDGSFYLIEISTDGEALWISAYSGHEANGGLELFLNKAEHERVVKEIGGNYHELVGRVRIKHGKISI